MAEWYEELAQFDIFIECDPINPLALFAPTYRLLQYDISFNTLSVIVCITNKLHPGAC